MTLWDSYIETRQQLRRAGIENDATEARFLLERFLNADYQQVVMDGKRIAEEPAVVRLRQAVEKRCNGYPLQYLMGEWEFYGYRFDVGEGVLIPRQDTECLCEAALEYLSTLESPRVLDLCSGSGCIAVTLAKQCPSAEVTAVERYDEAFSYLEKNIKKNGAEVIAIQGDALNPEQLSLCGTFDLIVSNPPYLTAEDMEHLQADVPYEPPSALYGETDGLLFYRELPKLWKKFLSPGGMIAFEIGAGQQESVAGFLEQAGYGNVCTACDLCGIIRVVTARNLPAVNNETLRPAHDQRAVERE